MIVLRPAAMDFRGISIAASTRSSRSARRRRSSGSRECPRDDGGPGFDDPGRPGGEYARRGSTRVSSRCSATAVRGAVDRAHGRAGAPPSRPGFDAMIAARGVRHPAPAALEPRGPCSRRGHRADRPRGGDGVHRRDRNRDRPALWRTARCPRDDDPELAATIAEFRAEEVEHRDAALPGAPKPRPLSDPDRADPARLPRGDRGLEADLTISQPRRYAMVPVQADASPPRQSGRSLGATCALAAMKGNAMMLRSLTLTALAATWPPPSRPPPRQHNAARMSLSSTATTPARRATARRSWSRGFPRLSAIASPSSSATPATFRPTKAGGAARRALEYVGRTGINSCTPVGPGGVTGCQAELMRAAAPSAAAGL